MTETHIRRTFEPFKIFGDPSSFFLFMRTAKGEPIYSVTYTWEAEGRMFAPLTKVFRFPFTRFAVAWGTWFPVEPDSIVPVRYEDAEFAMYEAVNGTIDRAEWSAARKRIAAEGLDPSDEMEVLQSLGLMG